MAKISKEELRKKLARRRNQGKKEKQKPEKQIEKNSTKNKETDLLKDLKRLAVISIATLVIFLIIIILKETTEIFVQISNLFYSLIN